MKTNHDPLRVLAVLALLTVQFSIATVSAQSTWTGATDGNWGTAGNWDPSGLPTNDAPLTFGVASNYSVNLGATTRTIGASSFTENYTFTNGTLAYNGNLTGASNKTVTFVDMVLTNTAVRTITNGTWVLTNSSIGGSANVEISGSGTKVVFSGSTGTNTGSGNLTVREGGEVVYGKSVDRGLGGKVFSFASTPGGTLRAFRALDFQATLNVASVNAVMANDSTNQIFNLGGNVQFNGSINNARLTLTSSNGGGFRFDNFIGLDRAATSSITIVTDAATTNGFTSGRGIRDFSGAGAVLSFIKGGTNAFVNLAGASNTYSGFTRIDAGVLEVQRMDQLGNSSDAATNLVFNGGALRYAGSNNATSTRGFNVAGTGSGNGINVSNASVALTMSGTNTGSGTFNKLGAGALILSGNGSARTGTNVVQAGALIVNGTQGGTTIVNSGATLGGSGTLGSATISGTHSPGNSPGIQTFTNGLTYNTGSTFVWELVSNTTANPGVAFDLVNVTGGALTINSGVTSSLVFNGTGSSVLWSDNFWGSNRSWLVFDATNASALSGSVFDTVSIGLDSGSNALTSVRGGAGFTWSTVDNDVYLNYVVPEPSTYALLGLAAAGLAGHLIRRRRRQL